MIIDVNNICPNLFLETTLNGGSREGVGGGGGGWREGIIFRLFFFYDCLGNFAVTM